MTPFYLQDARGFDPGLAGLDLLRYPPRQRDSSVLFPARSRIALVARCRACVGLASFSVGLYLIGYAGHGIGHLPESVLPRPCVVRYVDFPLPTIRSVDWGPLPIEMLGFAGSASALARYLGMATRHLRFDLHPLTGDGRGRRAHPVTACVEGRPDIILAGYQRGLHRHGRFGCRGRSP